MRFRPMSCDTEIHTGAGENNILLLGDIAARSKALLTSYEGRVQTIYLDPPFNTGKDYVLKQWCGEEGWATGNPYLEIPAYTDRWADDDAFLSMMRGALELSHALLHVNGSLFLHIDTRMHAHLRLMLDEIFGPKNFVNEIIWAYQTGGRSTKYFSRKHDIILFYRKSPSAYFDISPLGMSRPHSQKNHMKRSVDEHGRVYRSIVSQGKEYRYYDDQPVYPGDVWNDVSHLQQKDPQRTGYGNQKPLGLLERIILCSTRPGDLVCDLFAGSGTTGLAAAKLGRSFLLLDRAASAVHVARKRLLGYSMRVETPFMEGAPALLGGISPRLGICQIRLRSYTLEEGLCPLNLTGLDAVDQLSAGYVRDGVFYAYANAARSKAMPALPNVLEMPLLGGVPAIVTVDVMGRRMVHALEGEDDGEQI